jgi:hypothetical protein
MDLVWLDCLEVNHSDHAGLPSAVDQTGQSLDGVPIKVSDRPKHNPVPIHQDLDRWLGIRVIVPPHHFARPSSPLISLPHPALRR